MMHLLLSNTVAEKPRSEPHINVVLLTERSRSCFPLNFHVPSQLIFHHDLTTLSHLARFRKIDAFCLDLDYFQKEIPQFLSERLCNPELATIPLFIKASSNEDIERLIHYPIDDFYVGDPNSPILAFRLHKFLKHAESIAFEMHHSKNTSVELAFMAYYDTLTGLPNRQLFKERTMGRIESFVRDRSIFALMFMDLDGFKAINDTNDHKTGDWLLCQVASRLRNCIKRTDTVARLGGDEFGIILNCIENKADAESIANRVSCRLSAPYSHKGQHLRVHISIGISFFPENGKSYETLIQQADQAMYAAKKKGKGQFCFA